MAAGSIGRVLVLLAVAQFAGGCGSPDRLPASSAASTTDLDRLGHAISADAGYPPDTVELTSIRLRLPITTSDAKLAQSDESARTAPEEVARGRWDRVSERPESTFRHSHELIARRRLTAA